MDDVCSVACPATAGSASVAVMRDASRSLLRWVVLGAASLVLFILAIAHSGSVGAAAPCVQINYTTCVAYGATFVGGNAVTYTAAPSGYPPNTVLSTYYDPRYGLVSVVTDATGNLIDVNAVTGQRFYPFPEYGFGAGFIGANFVGNPAFINGNGFFGNGFNYLNGNVCNVVNCAVNTFPAGGTVVGGVVYYNDNRFCGDGKVAFVPGRGYFCQNGAPLFRNGATVVNCANFFFDGCGVYRPFEVSNTATTPAQTTPVTTYAAPAPKAAVTAPAAPVVAPAAVVAPQVPVVAPMAAPSVTVAPAATTVDRDDHQG